MSMLKSVAQVSGAAAFIFALNGLVNFGLMQPLAGGSEVFNRFRYHLDDFRSINQWCKSEGSTERNIVRLFYNKMLE